MKNLSIRNVVLSIVIGVAMVTSFFYLKNVVFNSQQDQILYEVEVEPFGSSVPVKGFIEINANDAINNVWLVSFYKSIGEESICSFPLYYNPIDYISDGNKIYFTSDGVCPGLSDKIGIIWDSPYSADFVDGVVTYFDSIEVYTVKG